MSKTYIELEKLAEDICNYPALDEHTANAMIWLIHRQPAAEVEVVKHGVWTRGSEGLSSYAHCSACNRKLNSYVYGYARCPICGAHMDGKERN